jgi:hypothetical protein
MPLTPDTLRTRSVWLRHFARHCKRSLALKADMQRAVDTKRPKYYADRAPLRKWHKTRANDFANCLVNDTAR